MLSIWILAGTIYLIYLTWQDYTKHMRVDDRYNFYMFGATMMLAGIYRHPWYFFVILSVVVFLLTMIIKKVLGEADVHSIIWIYLGYGLISLIALTYFTGIFIACNILYFIGSIAFSRFIYGRKSQGKIILPYYGIILLSWTLSTIMIWLSGII